MPQAACLLAVAVVLIALPARGATPEEEKAAADEKAAEAAKAFESVYGAELKRVRATRELKDDLELAARLLAAAKDPPTQTEFVTLLCETAYELAGQHADGYAAAIEAMDLLAAKVPDRAAACTDKLIAIRQKQFDATKGDERAKAGEALIDLLLPVADDKARKGAEAEALGLYRRVEMLARAVSSPRRDPIEARIKALTQKLKTAREIEDLKAVIARDPANRATREGLVRRLVVELDNPAEAGRFLEGVADAALLKFVPAAAKGVEAAPEMACIELGQWYRVLAETAPAGAKAAMLNRAKAYYRRFLDLHAAEDIDRGRASLALKKSEEDAASLAAAAVAVKPRPTPPAKTPAPAAGWIDLVALVDPARDAVKGSWQREGAGLLLAAPVGNGRIMFPQPLAGGYELQVRFLRRSGTHEIEVLLPVGTTTAAVVLSHPSGGAHGLEEINGMNASVNETTVKSPVLENGREYTLDMRVALDGSQARVSAALDGKRLFQWQGAQAALAMMGGWRLPNASCAGIGASLSVLEVRSAKARLLGADGPTPVQPTPVGPAKVPAKTPATPAVPVKVPAGGQVIDLLALIDPAADVVAGQWQHREGLLVLAKSCDGARLAIPCTVEGDYYLKVEFVRPRGNADVAFILPVGGRNTILILAKEGGSRSGLWFAKDATDLVKPAPLANDAPHVLEVTVQTGGNSASINVQLDSKPYFHWTGPLSSVTPWGDFQLPNAKCPGLGSWNGNELVYKTVELRMLSGRARPIPRLAAEPLPVGQVIAPLSLVDVDRDVADGTWRRQGPALVTTSNGGRIVLPVTLTGGYEFQVRLTRLGGGDGVGPVLPVGQSGALLALSALAGRCHTLARIDGKDENETSVRPGSLINGREYLLYVKVLVEGDSAQVAATLDGKPLISWRGPPSALSVPETWGGTKPGCLALGAWGSSVAFRDARLKVLSGEAKVLRPAAAAKPPAKP